MPTYCYECPCGTAFERVLPVARYDEPQTCDCGKVANKVMTAPILAWARQDVNYDCPRTGKPITSMAQHRDNLARLGCQQYDPGMRTDADNFRKRQDAELDKAVEETVEREVETMPSRKKEQLERELTSGMDVETVRGSGIPT